MILLTILYYNEIRPAFRSTCTYGRALINTDRKICQFSVVSKLWCYSWCILTISNYNGQSNMLAKSRLLVSVKYTLTFDIRFWWCFCDSLYLLIHQPFCMLATVWESKRGSINKAAGEYPLLLFLSSKWLFEIIHLTAPSWHVDELL